jgi:aminopeptidase N
VALRALARTAGDLDEVAWLQTQTADDMDQRWRTLARKAELGGAIGTELALLLDRDPDPDARVRGFAVRAATPDADEKMAVWQTLVVDRAVPIGSARQIATAFWRPGQHDLLSPYAKRYLDLVPNLDRGGMIPAMAFTSLLFQCSPSTKPSSQERRHQPNRPPPSSAKHSQSDPTWSDACCARVADRSPLQRVDPR